MQQKLFVTLLLLMGASAVRMQMKAEDSHTDEHLESSLSHGTEASTGSSAIKHVANESLLEEEEEGEARLLLGNSSSAIKINCQGRPTCGGGDRCRCNGGMCLPPPCSAAENR
mmetsp:Transcript_51617/g.90130  ORF Transcript_51617/g.90130 Transcript_51617/m.90130 type:complete len:113 (-) Transcript_51617:62-400(-)